MKPPFSNKRFPPFQGTDIHTYIHTYMHTCFIYLEPYTIKKESYEVMKPTPPPPLSLSLSLPLLPYSSLPNEQTMN